VQNDQPQLVAEAIDEIILAAQGAAGIQLQMKGVIHDTADAWGYTQWIFS
jgi:hypothetical protein